jgi:hypothetical protein
MIISRHHIPSLLVFVLLISLANPCEARVWKLWGGKATIDLPNAYKLTAAGPYAYQVMALKSGFDPAVINITIAKLPGAARKPDWRPLVSTWQQHIKINKPKVIIAPRGKGNFFDLEYAQLPNSHNKKRVIHGPRTKTDTRNLYDITLIATPSKAISSGDGKALLKSVKSFKVKP